MPLKTASLFVMLVALILSGCAKKTTEAVGEDGVDWAARARQYKEDPEALRLFAEQCADTEARLETVQRELTRYRQQTGSADQTLTNTQAELAASREQTRQAMAENEQLRQQLATMAAAKTDQVDTDRAVVQGVIFQVQLGAYAQNTIDPDLATENALELQDQEGLQKVVVSQFRTYANAARLRDRLKVMGVRDAFVVAKNNGQRITVPEALKMTGQG